MCRFNEPTTTLFECAPGPASCRRGERSSRAPVPCKPGKAVSAVKASVRIGDVIADGPIEPRAKEVVFRIALPLRKTQKTAHLMARDGNAVGLFCPYVKTM